MFILYVQRGLAGNSAPPHSETSSHGWTHHVPRAALYPYLENMAYKFSEEGEERERFKPPCPAYNTLSFCSHSSDFNLMAKKHREAHRLLGEQYLPHEYTIHVNM